MGFETSGDAPHQYVILPLPKVCVSVTPLVERQKIHSRNLRTWVHGGQCHDRSHTQLKV